MPETTAHHENTEIHVCTNSPLWFANLRSEEVVIRKGAQYNFCSWSSWKCQNTHAYLVSLPSIAWFACLRSEEVVIGKVLRPLFLYGRHGNAEIHMCTKFHFRALNGVQV